MDKEIAEPDIRIGSDWLTIQQQYWENWLNLAPKLYGVAANSFFGKYKTSDAPTESSPLRYSGIYPVALSALDTYFKGILELNQLSVRTVDRLVGGTRQPVHVFDRWFEDIEKLLSASGIRAGKSSSDLRHEGLALWDLPLDTWRRTMSSMLPVPGDFLHAMKDEGVTRVATEFRERMDRFLGIPAVGYSREYLDQYQEFTSLFLNYLESLQEYSTAFSYIGIRANENFFEKLGQRITTPISSFRKIYDLWVDAYEEAYSEYVMSDEYASLHGRMINALIAVKHCGSSIIDELLDGMNMPTRREIDTMHRRLNELQRQNHALHAELERINGRLPRETAQTTR